MTVHVGGLFGHPPRAPTMHSTGTAIAHFDSTVRKLYPKTNIEIQLDNDYSSKVYTSGSCVSGKVVIVPKRDIRFDTFQILLVGNAKTRLEGAVSPVEVNHTFLRIAMPIPESTYPVPRLMETDREYTVPFSFIIPGYLTVNACNHTVTNDQVRDQHTGLPPSMGDWQEDDMAPAMAAVSYSLRARVFRNEELAGRPVKVVEAIQNITVLPASAEEPPLSVNQSDLMYNMRRAKTVRKNLFSSKQGCLTAEAAQPSAIFLRPDGRGATETTAQVALTFEPASSDVRPPEITGVSSKVVAHTYFSSSTIREFPDRGGSWPRQYPDKRGSYSHTVSLPATAIEQTRWAQHITSWARRDSGYGSAGEQDISDTESAGSGRRNSNGRKNSATTRGSPVVHNSVLQVPIRLPTDKKTFIPTFHSCITSRIYVLQLAVGLRTGSTTRTIHLSLPLQIAVESQNSDGLAGGLPSFEAALEQAEAEDVDAYLQPRRISLPVQMQTEATELPGY